MSRAEEFLASLLAAGKGVSPSERRAESRVKTNLYLDHDRKEMKDGSVLAGIKETEAGLQSLRQASSAAGDAILTEVYDEALVIFSHYAPPDLKAD